MKSKKKYIMLIFILVLAVLMFLLANSRKITCTETTSATVTDINTENSSSDIFYFAVYTYKVDGEKYTQQSNNGLNPCPVKVGDKVEIKYNPKKPNVFYAPIEQNKTNLNYLVFIVTLLPFIFIARKIYINYNTNLRPAIDAVKGEVRNKVENKIDSKR